MNNEIIKWYKWKCSVCGKAESCGFKCMYSSLVKDKPISCPYSGDEAVWTENRIEPPKSQIDIACASLGLKGPKPTEIDKFLEKIRGYLLDPQGWYDTLPEILNDLSKACDFLELSHDQNKKFERAIIISTHQLRHSTDIEEDKGTGEFLDMIIEDSRMSYLIKKKDDIVSYYSGQQINEDMTINDIVLTDDVYQAKKYENITKANEALKNLPEPLRLQMEVIEHIFKDYKKG